jgi:hypothetical protein
MTDTEDRVKQSGLAIKAKRYAEAKQLLGKVLRDNPRHELAWFYMAFCVDTEERRIHCLNRVLSINPNNKKARKLLDEIVNPSQPEKLNLEHSDTSIKNVDKSESVDEVKDGKECPYCKSIIPVGASVCPHCQREVSKLDLWGKFLSKIGCWLFLLGITLPCLFILIGALLTE